MTWASYSYIFLQSNFLEIPLYLYFYHQFLKTRYSLTDQVLLVTLSNLITHPIVFFIIMALPFSFLTNILLAESFAILGEYLIHRKLLNLPKKTVLKASITSNLFSWQLAPILTYAIFY